MKFGPDKIKYWGRFFALILLLAAALLIILSKPREEGPEAQASKLMRAGDYVQAAEKYLEAGDSDMYSHCLQLYAEQRYLSAQNMLRTGDYEAAIEGFELLGGYKQSRDLLSACCYLWASELAAQGDYSAALRLCRSMEDYPGLEALLEKCSEGIISHAAGLAREGRYAEAGAQLEELGKYADAPLLAAQAERMADILSQPGRGVIIAEENKFSNSYYERVYKTELAYAVLPEQYSGDCRFLLYFPGGKDDEINIDFLYYYLMNPAPDTVAVFLRTNGIYDSAAKCRTALEFMEELAAECGLFIREIVSCGSSLGAYPAMQSAVHIPRQSGIAVPCVLSLDAGDDWNSPYTLSRSQCMETAAAGTEFYLFESPWVGTDRAAIRLMVETGNQVILVGCEYDEHVRITLDAMGMGVLHWAVGDRKEPCKLDIYSFTKLYA